MRAEPAASSGEKVMAYAKSLVEGSNNRQSVSILFPGETVMKSMLAELLIGTFRMVAILVCAVAVSTQETHAVSYTWNVASGDWDTAGNWTPGGGPPGTGAGDDGTISSGTATANATLGMSANVFVSGTGVLDVKTAANPITLGTVEIQSGGLLEWNGNPATGTAVTLKDGSKIGKFLGWTSANTSRENFTIDAGATVDAGYIRAHSPIESGHRLQLLGSISGGAGATILVKPNLYTADTEAGAGPGGQGELRIAPTSANSYTGTVQVEGISSTKFGILGLAGTGALANATLAFNDNAILRFASATDAFGVGAATINVPASSRVMWEGATTYTGVVPTINVLDGFMFEKYSNWTSASTSRENIAIASGATVSAGGIRAHSPIEGNHRLQLLGQISGDGTTKILVKPDLYTADTEAGAGPGGQGEFRIAPTSANPFMGTVEVEGLSSTQLAILGLGGTGALANATLDFKDNSILRFTSATDPFGAGAATINVNGTQRVAWEASSNYTGTAATLNLFDEARIGRFSNWTSVSTSRENIAIQSGATVRADGIRSHSPDATGQRLQLLGVLSGDSTTSISVIPNLYTDITSGQGVLRINPNAALGNTSFAGTVNVSGLSNTAGQHGFLELLGVKPLGSGNLNIGAHGIVAVAEDGALDDATSTTVGTDGRLLFRRNGTSTLANTTLKGHGLVRAESTGTSLTVDTALRDLFLSNVVVAPGTSAGTLTVEAISLAMDASSTLEIELGSLGQDLLLVDGDLDLTTNPTLQIELLDASLGSGIYPIVTYTGTLNGEFGSLVNNLGSDFVLNFVDYGSGINDSISVSITQLPEPSSVVLVGMGLLGMNRVRRRRIRRRIS